MKCPNCGLLTNNSKVLDSRPSGVSIKRRRECNYCQGRWITYEVVETEYYSERNKHQYIGWREGELKTLVTLNQQGKTKTEIAKLLGRSRTSVSRRIDKLIATGEYFQFLEEIS